jgi:hypothetical protein
MDDLKAQVKRLEDANASLTTRNAELAREAARLPALRSTVEELKDAKAALVSRWLWGRNGERQLRRPPPPPSLPPRLQEVRVAELEAGLASSKADAAEMRAALAVAMESQAAAAAAAVAASTARASAGADSLGAELAALVGGVAGGSDAGGITAGVSEYNPAVAAKIARLEQEVAELRAGGSGASAGEMAALAGQLDDMRRMKAVYEAKYNTVSQPAHAAAANHTPAPPPCPPPCADQSHRGGSGRSPRHCHGGAVGGAGGRGRQGCRAGQGDR